MKSYLNYRTLLQSIWPSVFFKNVFKKHADINVPGPEKDVDGAVNKWGVFLLDAPWDLYLNENTSFFKIAESNKFKNYLNKNSTFSLALLNLYFSLLASSFSKNKPFLNRLMSFCISMYLTTTGIFAASKLDRCIHWN